MPALAPPRPPPRPRLAAGVLALALAAAPARAAETRDPNDVQAAMLVSLARFVSWPGGARPAAPLRVCAVGAARFAAALSELARHGAAVEVAAVRSPGATRCQAAILGPGLEHELEEAAETLAAAGVLTFSALPDAGRRGVHVTFVVDGDRVRFEVNLAAARRAGFEISSKVLRLARAVEGGAP